MKISLKIFSYSANNLSAMLALCLMLLGTLCAHGVNAKCLVLAICGFKIKINIPQYLDCTKLNSPK